MTRTGGRPTSAASAARKCTSKQTAIVTDTDALDAVDRDVTRPAHVVDGRVARDAQHPHDERRLARPVAVEARQKLGKDLLGDVVGIVEVPYDAQHVGMDRGGVQDVELPHRLAVPGTRRADDTACAALLGVIEEPSGIRAAVSSGARRPRAARRQHQASPRSVRSALRCSAAGGEPEQEQFVRR